MMNDEFRFTPRTGRRNPRPLRRGQAPVRDFLRFIGPAIVVIGLAFTIVGIGSFFAAFGTFGPPRYFWCAFVGLPVFGFGAFICQIAYLGPMSRYVAEETAPVQKDVINYLAAGTEPAVRSVVGAIKEELSAPDSEARDKACPNCGERNQSHARFCTQCGSEMSAATACAHCGAQNEPTAAYCAHCGKELATG